MSTATVTGAVLGVLVIGGTAWNVSDRKPPVELRIEIRNPVVRPGEDIEVAYTIQRARVCEAVAKRYIYDGADREHTFDADERAAFGRVGQDYRVIRLRLSEDASPGAARYRLISTFRCNAFHDFWPITVVYPDVPFTIAPSPLAERPQLP